MENHTIATPAQWLAARKELLAKEKEFTRVRDELSRRRRELPWERVEKTYQFKGPNGAVTLPELFEGKSQLVIYHFMFDPSWDAGCKSCSFWADSFNGNIVHLNHRDVTMVTVSRAPLDKLEAYRKRMGWTFKWFSSDGSDFNRDYRVSHTAEELTAGEGEYNYTRQRPYASESPGLGVFFNDGNGGVFHTYSCYARGLDMLNACYQLLDLVPKGRDEDNLPFHMDWLKRHDEYAD